MERLTLSDMEADRVVFHAAKDDAAANKLYDNLAK
jgi:hypothetical protein